MILWCDGAHDPPENMRRDAALLERIEHGAGEDPVLRVFQFDPHGITLGASQDPARLLDRARCERDGIPFAVRPTGGRAIFHAEEWTYSLSARLDDPEWGGSLRESYATTAGLLISSLLRLGVPVEPAPAGRRGLAGGAAAGAACFATTAGHEIVVGGRKLVGSAQRRLSRAFLQQGSLLLGPGHLRLADYLLLPDAAKAATREGLARRTVDAGRWVGAAPLDRWAESLASCLAVPPLRVSGEAGLATLTLYEADSYTPAQSTPPAAPSS
ncbi:MAG: hypothetical protein ABIS67_04600, partial [Candidatus Eisenbacteria bacterium]